MFTDKDITRVRKRRRFYRTVVPRFLRFRMFSMARASDLQTSFDSGTWTTVGIRSCKSPGTNRPDVGMIPFDPG
jgi:hypothetical protein